MGSVMDFGTIAGDWTPEWSPVTYNWNFVTCVSKPKHMAQSDHDQRNTFIRYLLSHLHPHLQK